MNRQMLWQKHMTIIARRWTNLNIEEIKKITTGIARITEEADGIHFYRFNQAEEEMYYEYNKDFHRKSFATSGVHMEFETDANSLEMAVNVDLASSRKFFAVDLYVDGKYVDCIRNFTDEQINVTRYHKLEVPLGDFSKKFDLGEGNKKIKLFFPWSVSLVLKEFKLEGETYVNPVEKKTKILAYGDSITHGYDATHPSNSYAELMAQALDAEILNKAIGGEIFKPELSAIKNDFIPDFITVAYGTNDWDSAPSVEVLEKNCRGFMENLIKNYPGVKIFAFTPIWRDAPTGRVFDFEELDSFLQNIYKDYNEITCISARHFVPESSDYFADLVVHPNDAGFKYYAEGVVRELKKYIS